MEEYLTAKFPGTVENASLVREVQPRLLLRSTELSGRPDTSSGMCALMLPEALAVNEALAAKSTLVRSFPGVEPVVHLQFLGSRVALATDAASERSVFAVGLVMCS